MSASQLAQTYCAINYLLVAVALVAHRSMKTGSTGSFLLGILFANSLLVMVTTRVLLQLYPGILTKVIHRFAPIDPHQIHPQKFLYTGTDFFAHVLPFLLCLPWAIHVGALAALVPPMVFIVYILCAPIERIYKLHDKEVDKITILKHTLLLYTTAILFTVMLVAFARQYEAPQVAGGVAMLVIATLGAAGLASNDLT